MIGVWLTSHPFSLLVQGLNPSTSIMPDKHEFAVLGFFILLCFPGWPLTPVFKWTSQQAGLQTFVAKPGSFNIQCALRFISVVPRPHLLFVALWPLNDTVNMLHMHTSCMHFHWLWVYHRVELMAHGHQTELWKDVLILSLTTVFWILCCCDTLSHFEHSLLVRQQTSTTCYGLHS